MVIRIANSVPLKEHTRCLINGFFRAWVVLLHSKRYLWFGLMKFRKPRHCGSNNFAARNCDQNKKRKNELSTVAFAFECAISGLFFFIFPCTMPNIGCLVRHNFNFYFIKQPSLLLNGEVIWQANFSLPRELREVTMPFVMQQLFELFLLLIFLTYSSIHGSLQLCIILSIYLFSSDPVAGIVLV